ncbi:MAG: GIY-YIG nuclease family protein [Dehalococcoidia bacterium]
MLRCADDSCYIGQTNDLAGRLALHEAGFGGDYTSRRLPVGLASSESFGTQEETLACERQIKRWSRARKAALATGDWNRLSLLSRSRGSTGSPRTENSDTPSAPSPRTDARPILEA